MILLHTCHVVYDIYVSNITLINNSEFALSQHADETILLLDGTKKSLRNTMKTIDNFAIVSGLKVNVD